jgi:hypothetical protein
MDEMTRVVSQAFLVLAVVVIIFFYKAFSVLYAITI